MAYLIYSDISMTLSPFRSASCRSFSTATPYLELYQLFIPWFVTNSCKGNNIFKCIILVGSFYSNVKVVLCQKNPWYLKRNSAGSVIVLWTKPCYIGGIWAIYNIDSPNIVTSPIRIKLHDILLNCFLGIHKIPSNII